MISILKYLVEMLLCSGIFILLYKGLLEGRTSYRGSRIYLIVSAIASVAIPLLEIPVWPSEMIYMDLDLTFSIPKDATADDIIPAIEAVTSPKKHNTWILPLIYGTAALISLCFGFAGIIRIGRLRKEAKITEREDYTLAESENIKSPFSFIRTIFIGTGLEADEKEIIITHEKSHIRHRHSHERLFMKLMTSIFWVNPFMRLKAKYLEEVQEWEADSEVIGKGYDIELYRFIIFKQLFGYYPEISCGLKNSLTKKRFSMMDTKIKKFGSLRLAAALTLVAGTTFLFGATAKPVEYPTELSAARIIEKNPKTILIEITEGGKTVKIDGGLSLDDDWNFKPEQNVIIRADPDVPMGIITDIKDKLREKNVLKVTYQMNPAAGTQVIEITEGGNSVTINGKPAAEEDWTFEPGQTIQITADPDVSADKIREVKEKLRKNNLEELAFVDQIYFLSAEESEEKNIIFGMDSSKGSAPSKASVTGEIREETDADCLTLMTTALRQKPGVKFILQTDDPQEDKGYLLITAAYHQLWNDYSQQNLGKAFNDLSENDQLSVMTKIPTNIEIRITRKD